MGTNFPFEDMTDPQIDDMLDAAEQTARTNREFEAALATKRSAA